MEMLQAVILFFIHFIARETSPNLLFIDVKSFYIYFTMVGYK